MNNSSQRQYHLIELLTFTLLALFIVPGSALCQSGPPIPPPISTHTLSFWPLETPPWESFSGQPARAFTNVNLVPSWDYEGTALSLDTNVPAFLQLYVFQDGKTNISLASGSLEVWCQPNWTSMASGGTGPGAWATVWDIGQYIPDAAAGAWLLAVDPSGSNLVWLAQSGGSNQFLWTPIGFNAGDWHQVVATWSSSNACLYVDGALATNAGPLIYGPSSLECSNAGFCVGSLSASGTNAGTNQFQGQLQWLVSYAQPLTAAEVSNSYAQVADYITYFGYNAPGGGGFHADDGGGLPALPGDGTNLDGGGGGSEIAGFTPPASISATNYAAYNQFYLTITNDPTNAYITVCNSLSNITYVILTNGALSSPGWRIWQIITATNGTTAAPAIPIGPNAPLFFNATMALMTGTNGLADWWQMKYFGHLNVDPFADPDSDGLCNLAEYTLGTDPTNAHTITTNHTDAEALYLAYTNDASTVMRLFVSTDTNLGIATITLSNTLVGSNYQVYSKDLTVTNSAWAFEQNFISTNAVTQTTIVLNGRTLGFIAGYGEDTDGDGLPDGYEVLATHTDPTLADTGLTGTPDGLKNPDGDAFNNIQEYQNGTDPLVYNPTPSNWYGSYNVDYNPDGTSATISWTPASGPVTGYTILFYDFSLPDYGPFFLVNLSAGVTNYTDTTSDFNDVIAYVVEADYPGGSVYTGSAPPPPPPPITPLTAALIRGPAGSMYLALITVPPGTTGIQLSLTPSDCNWSAPSSLSETIPMSSFTNNLYSFSETEYPLYYDYTVSVLASNATSSNLNPIVIADCDSGIRYPFLDGSDVLKDNLLFALQMQPQVPTDPSVEAIGIANVEGIGLGTRSWSSRALPVYAYASYHDGWFWPAYNPGGTTKPLHPWEMNAQMSDYLFQIPSASCFTDASYSGGSGSESTPYDGWYSVAISGVNYFDSAGFALDQETNVCPSILPSPSDRAFANYDPLEPGNSFYTTVPSGPNAYGITMDGTYIAYLDGTTEVTNFIAPGSSLTNEAYGAWEKYDAPIVEPQFYQFTTAANLASLSPDTVGVTGLPVTNLLIATVGSQFDVSAWLRYKLDNGYSDIYGYVEQYFDKAYLVDSNGTVTTNQTGILSPYGEFFPTQPGLVALTTRTNADTGGTGTGFINVIALNLDGNHDGIMDTSLGGPDNTSPLMPYQFWINNNYDRLTLDSDGTNFYDDDVASDSKAALGIGPNANVRTPDYNYVDGNSNRIISCERDLQDFARLWVSGITTNLLAELPANSTVRLYWSAATNGAPGIDVFAAADSDGGIGYLTNSSIAAAQVDQIAYPYLGRVDYNSGQSIKLNASNSWAGNHFIWCGTSAGSGTLTLGIFDGNGDALAQTSVYIQIQDIKQMYERWTIGDLPGTAPTNIAWLAEDDFTPGQPAVQFQYGPVSDPNTPYILYVHGWNMQVWEKDRFAESAFKRLYWQGYQGRFGIFRWPTDYGFEGNWSALTDPRNFDNSEFQAWKSAAGLLNTLENLNAEYPGKVYVLAHSMGNVVTGEALRLADTNQVANAYVATQAAVTAHVYDGSITNPSYLLPFTYAYPTGPLSELPEFMTHYGPDTPNIYTNRLAGNSAAVGRRVNFYNVNDYALAMPRWGFDQITKPDQSGGQIYQYNGSPNDPPPWNNFSMSQWGRFPTLFDIVNNLTDRYQVFACAAEARATALGATPVVGGMANVDLQGVWPSDPSGHNYSDHFWHSAEFRGDYWEQWSYWTELLSSDAFNLR